MLRSVALQRSQRRLLLIVAALPLTVLVFALVYMLGMSTLEGQERGFWQSLEWAAETLTTTGYGRDAEWAHPVMLLFVIGVQFSGVLFVVLVGPVYLIPYFEERFEGRLPVLGDLRGRVVVYRHGPAVVRLVRELDQADLRPLVFEEDEALARRLLRRGVDVAYGASDDPETFQKFAEASAIVANGPDDEDAAMILDVRGRGFEGPIVALVASPGHRRPMMLAGATAAFTPRHVLAAELCARADVRISPRVTNLGRVGEDRRAYELRIHSDSRLAGHSLGELAKQCPGVEVIALIEDEDKLAPVAKDVKLSAGLRLAVIAPPKSRQALVDAIGPARDGRRFVVIGGGEVAFKVRQMLTDVGEEVFALSSTPGDGIDHVGDPLETATLDRAQAKNAAAVVLALQNDAATLFATAVLHDYKSEISVIAGLERSDRIARTRAAGADFSIALDEVTGRLLAHHLREGLRGRHGMILLRRRAAGLINTPQSPTSVLARSGCAVIGVFKDGELVLADDTVPVNPSDEVLLCGPRSLLEED